MRERLDLQMENGENKPKKTGRGNPDNLIKNSERTPEERSENARKMGIASGEARRRKRDAKETIRLLMEMDAAPSIKANLKKTLNIKEEDSTNMMAMIVALMQEAVSKGNIAAFTTLMDYGGYNPDQLLKDQERLARIDAITTGGRAGAVMSGEEDSGGDVIIYLPQVEEEEAEDTEES